MRAGAIEKNSLSFPLPPCLPIVVITVNMYCLVHPPCASLIPLFECATARWYSRCMASNLDPFGDDDASAQAVTTTARDLALAGLTDTEIAAATGRSVESVQSDPAVLVPLGDAHIARIERALYGRAVGGVTWEERLDKLGEVRRVEAQVLPDPKAATTILERRAPERWQAGRQEQLNVVIVRIEGTEGKRVTIDAQREPIDHDPGAS